MVRRIVSSISQSNSHRGVSPVIAQMMLLVITVIGGSMIYSSATEVFESSQTSDHVTIDSLKILGYDARDVDALLDFNRIQMPPDSAGDPNTAGKNKDERIAVYIQSDSVHKMYISELSFAGKEYVYEPLSSLSLWNGTDPRPGEYTVMVSSIEGIISTVPEIASGDFLLILIDVDDDLPIGREALLIITTTDQRVFSKTITIGTYSGQYLSTYQVSTPVNLAPVAYAGPDQSVDENDLVILDGSLSYDPNGDPISYLWTQIGGPGVTLNNPTTANPNFIANHEEVTYTFRLAVNDGSLADDDEVEVYVDDD